MDLTEDPNATDSPSSALWPCPDCGGALAEIAAGRIDYVHKCARCGWEKMLERSIPQTRVWARPHLRPTSRRYDG